MPREKDIVINGWVEGVAPSPMVGYNMRNVDIDAIPGVVQAGLKVEQASNVEDMNGYVAKTFTADDTTDIITISSQQTMLDGTPCELTTTNTLPSGLATSTVYYVNSIDSTTLKLYATYDDAIDDTNEIDITDTGTGTHTLTPTKVGLVTYIVQDNSDSPQTYACDDEKAVWKVTTSSTRAWEWLGEVSGFNTGMVYWKDYLLVAQSDDIDAYNPSSGVWTRNLMQSGSLETSFAPHYMMIGPDDRVYIANGRYLARIEETDGQDFDPTDTGTYSDTINALNLPEDEEINAIVALGVDLMLGTTSSRIYRWDRVSDTYYNPLEVEAGNIDAMITMNNLVYIFPSGSHKIYVTDGTNINAIAELPKYLTGEQKSSGTPGYYMGAVYIDDEKIWFSIDGNSSDAIGFIGVWSLTPQGVLNYEQQNSQASTGTTRVSPGALSKSWLCYATGGVDYVDYRLSDEKWGSWEAFIESPLIRIGTSSQRKTLRQFDVYLAQGLPDSCGVRLKVRDDLYASWSTVGSIDESTNGSLQKYTFDYFYEGENIQIRVELDTKGDSEDTPRLIEIRAR